MSAIPLISYIKSGMQIARNRSWLRNSYLIRQACVESALLFYAMGTGGYNFSYAYVQLIA